MKYITRRMHCLELLNLIFYTFELIPLLTHLLYDLGIFSK